MVWTSFLDQNFIVVFKICLNFLKKYNNTHTRHKYIFRFCRIGDAISRFCQKIGNTLKKTFDCHNSKFDQKALNSSKGKLIETTNKTPFHPKKMTKIVPLSSLKRSIVQS